MQELNPVNKVKDVAEYLKVSESTVHKLVQKGKLKTIKAIGKTRITKQAVEEFINT